VIGKNLQKINQQIALACSRAGRSPEKVKIIAVTKKFSPDAIKQALELNITDLGENRIQEAVPKIEQLPEGITWHFVGHLQTNKAKEAARYFSLIHSLDRYSLARELQKQAEHLSGEIRQPVRALVQVNVSGEDSKHGLEPRELKDFLDEVHRWEALNIEGLMTMAPYVEDPEEVRPVFRRLRELRDSLAVTGLELRELSMGMTNDFPVAVEEGATMLRIGTALFGPRE